MTPITDCPNFDFIQLFLSISTSSNLALSSRPEDKISFEFGIKFVPFNDALLAEADDELNPANNLDGDDCRCINVRLGTSDSEEKRLLDDADEVILEAVSLFETTCCDWFGRFSSVSSKNADAV